MKLLINNTKYPDFSEFPIERIETYVISPRIKNEYIESEKELYKTLKSEVAGIELEVLKISGEHENVLIDVSNKDRLKVLFVPITVKREEVVPVDGAKFSEVLDKAKNIEKLESFKNGLFTVQDEAAGLTSLILDPKKGESILKLISRDW